MKLRFQADADLNQRIVAALRRLEPAIDLQTAGQAMLEGKSDPEVLTYCADEGRTLLTHDQKTMPHHFAAFITGRSSPGAIIVPQAMPIGHAVQEVYLAWTASEAEEWINGIRRLPL